MNTSSITVAVEDSQAIPGTVTIDGSVVRVESVKLRYAPYEGAPRALVADLEIRPLPGFETSQVRYRSNVLVEVQTPDYLARASDGFDDALLSEFASTFDVAFGTEGRGAPSSVNVHIDISPA